MTAIDPGNVVPDPMPLFREKRPLDIEESRHAADKLAEKLKKANETPESLLDRMMKQRFDPSAIPPPDEAILSIEGGYLVAARGNLTALQGQVKVGKSAVVAAIIGAVLRANYSTHSGDCLKFEWEEASDPVVLHLDTEQSPSDWHALCRRAITRSGMNADLVMPRLISLPLVTLSRLERLALLEAALHTIKPDVVILDGVADLCESPNDEAESLGLVTKLHGLAVTYNCAIFCVLHENPSGTESGKTRGHLGSELSRKAFANLRIEKDANEISVLYGQNMRKRALPKKNGVAFQWNESVGMHTCLGTYGAIIAESRRSVKTEKHLGEVEKIFGESDSLSWSDLSARIHEVANLKSDSAVENRIKAYIADGLIRKNDAGIYTVTPHPVSTPL